MAVSTQKVVILLTQPKDWVDWYEVVRSTAQRKGIFDLIDVEKAEAPTPLEKLNKPLPANVSKTATTLSALTADQQALFRVLFDEYKDRVREYKQ